MDEQTQQLTESPVISSALPQVLLSPINEETLKRTNTTGSGVSFGSFEETPSGSPQEYRKPMSLFGFMSTSDKPKKALSGSNALTLSNAVTTTGNVLRSLTAPVTSASNRFLNAVVAQDSDSSIDSREDIIRAPAAFETPVLENGYTTEDDEDAFLMARLHTREATPELDDLARTKSTTSWIRNQVQTRFQTVKESVMGTEVKSEDGVDWDFWGKIINDYDVQVRKQPRLFTKKLRQGIPEPIRGMMWQLMSKSKSESMENEYLELLTGSSRHEKVIQRDLARTFPGHEYFKDESGPGQTSLFNVLKAYSIHDQDVGYCQGIAFIVGPLLLNMPEEQAFCVLVRMMNEYGFRDLYAPKMVGLQIRNYQFDKLLNDQFPNIFKHLDKQDIRSTMYASQWFMTLFAYRFPIHMVYRIMDIVFAEGSEAVLRFALALMKHNQDTICTLDFEPLLEFLKTGLFDLYVNDINQLVTDASEIKISKSKLDKWTLEYTEDMKRTSPEVMHAEALKLENRKWYDAYRKLENNYEALNREHIELANKLLEKSMMVEVESERLAGLEDQVASLKQILAMDRKVAEDAVRSEMDELGAKNSRLTQKNAELQESLGDMESRVTNLSLQYAQATSENEELTRKLDRLKKALGA